MDAQSFNITIQGAGHIRQGKICQDASIRTPDYLRGSNRFLVAVCDGHGGSDYIRSHIGSRLASEVAMENICAFMEKATDKLIEKDVNRQLRYLSDNIVGNWRDRVRSHLKENPFSDDELEVLSPKALKKYTEEDDDFFSAYGTTLIAACYTEKYCFGLQIGDGKCVLVDKDGEFSQPIPWDEKCFLNVTTSICDKDAANSFRHFFSKEIPSAIFVASDGIDGCFKNDEQMYNMYRTIIYSIVKEGLPATIREFEDYLPRMSAMGSGDDMSLAGIVDISKLKALRKIYKQIDNKLKNK